MCDDNSMIENKTERERERNEKTRIRSVIEVKTRKVMMNVASVTTNIIARAVDGQSRLSLFIAHMATNVQLPMVGVNNKKGAGRQTQYSYSIPNKYIDGHYDDDAADHRLRKHRQSNC